MKMNIKLLTALSLTLAFLAGCGTGGFKTTPYSLLGDETITETAVLTFGKGIHFVDFEGRGFPVGSRVWSVLLPAGRSMPLRVYVYWDSDAPGTRRRGIFKCPPLEAGKEYNLKFEYKTKGVFIKVPADGSTITLEKKRETRSIFGPMYDQILSQVLPPIPQ